jgi:myo-inositol-1(or 4)-monophosphatase
MSDFMAVCEQAARAGGAALQDWEKRFTIREKGPKDLVTEADFASQQAIRKVVLSTFPDHRFLGEERDEADGDAAESAATGDGAYRWIVDPLDGTLNYIRGMPSYAVSVALERGGDVLAGVVFDPMLNECFAAAAGRGAFLNGNRIRASRCKSLPEALVAVSFSANVARDSVEVRRFVEVLHAGQAVRRSGSAALNLCYIASARLDAYFASSIQVWDVAAGVLVAREAGAFVTSIMGRDFDLRRPDLAVAATAELHAELLETLSRAE